MPHTPLVSQLRNLVANTRQQPAQQPRENCSRDGLVSSVSRRDFLRYSSLLTAGVATTKWSRAASAPKPSSRVVIVGAGLAGLTCAYRLKQAGVDATVYEAQSRIGGRCWTRRNDFADNQIAEHGGELIDQGHTSIRQLAQELRLPLDNLLSAEVNGTEPYFYFNGQRYSYTAATNDLKGIWQKVHRDLTDAGYPTLYNRSTERGRQLDQMSIIDWINESVPGGRSSPLGQLLDVAYTIEYGAECERQSALSLLYLLGYNSPGQFSLFGSSNEKYHVRGGNDRIASTLAYVLGSQIVPGTALVAARRSSSGTYTLSFQSGRRTFDLTADQVVFALPFSILRGAVDLRGAGFSALKYTAIQELAMGSNSKLNVQFKQRCWTGLGNNGDTYADTGYQATWEVSRGQSGQSGILVGYSGGRVADAIGQGTPDQQATRFLAQVEPVLPGLTAGFNGRVTVDCWSANPFSRGSYAYWQVGQYTRFAGIEGVREGNAYFCGEHTSIDSQGYLNGATETGERAAREVLSDLGL